MSVDPRLRYTPTDQKPILGGPIQGPYAPRQPHQHLLESIDAVLTEVLGCRVREAIYDHLARQSSLAREEIPTHLDEFSKLLEGTFGRGGATLERLIARKIYAKSGLKFVDAPNTGLKEHLQLIENILEQAERSNTKTCGRDQPILDRDHAFEVSVRRRQ